MIPRSVLRLLMLGSLFWVQPTWAEGQCVEPYVGFNVGTAWKGNRAQEITPSGTLGFACRLRHVRPGVDVRIIGSTPHGLALEGSGFLIVDLLSLNLDQTRHVSFFTRFDAGARYYTEQRGSPAVPLGLSVGLDVAGLSTQFGAGPVLNPQPIGEGNRAAVGQFESRFYVDLAEMRSFVHDAREMRRRSKPKRQAARCRKRRIRQLRRLQPD